MWKLIALYFVSDTTELLSGWRILAVPVLASPSKKSAIGMVSFRGVGLRVSSEVCACFEGRWPLTKGRF